MDPNTFSKQLLFNTVRIVTETPNGLSSGTGFIVDAAHATEGGDFMLPVIVTNKHVLAGATKTTVTFIPKEKGSSRPALGTAIEVDFGPGEIPTYEHPDPVVDVAAFELGPLMDTIEDEIFFVTLPREILPSAEVASKLDAVEEVTFVGYPNGYYDEQHYTPIIRRGITATPIALPFSGRPVFLVDGSVFGGSSGSPVFILNQGTYSDGKGSMILGSRLLLVGVIAATMLRHKELPLEVRHAPHTKLAQEINLGVVFDYVAITRVLDLIRDAKLTHLQSK
ncbi:trypsin-like peptidase domain-containing protein [Arthrobacter sp. Soc17.1.1.1]|uniref:trypsin-like peptidase domain-containing protein n=1 Tax=Arthrobacter sp. Soc17.1.1.1 TaxID=3121277 RepID=UPI002FE4A2DD